MWIKKLLVLSAAFGGVLLSAGEASAAYACGVRYLPGSTGGAMGNAGYILLHTYTGANCTGALLNTHFFCTTGATSASCPSNPIYRYSESGAIALFQELRDAGNANQTISVSNTACNGGAANCSSFVIFTAD